MASSLQKRFARAAHQLCYSAALPGSPPYKNTSITLSNICQQKTECNYPKKSKRSPQNVQQLLLCFLNSNPCLKCKMFVRGTKKIKDTTGATEAGE